MYNDFYLDLEDGKRGERLVAAALTARGHKVTDLSDDREARFNDIDLLLDNGKQTTTLEVKNDLRSETTGNVFIETYNIKNISHSFEGWFFYCRACYVCFIQENNRLAHIVALNDIKEIIEKNKYRIANSSNAKGYLVPIDDIKALTSYYCLTL